ncbi:MAG: hypothetical protein IT379_18845, partial [Deltaproteobacteria bacterium]|nr:hypothetical protein [Deltaproteobacteria bacterium]
SEVLVASSLPDIGYMTLSDKAHAAGLAFIFFALLESVIVAHLARAGRTDRASRIDRISMVASYVGFAGTFVGLILAA